MSYILVVDDQATVREPIAWSLRLAGYEAVMAADGKAAFAQMCLSTPRLVVLDVQMPGMSGFELLEAMRAEPSLRDVPVLLLTAAADTELVARAARLRVKGYLVKSSFSLPDLLKRVQQHARPPAASPAPPTA